MTSRERLVAASRGGDVDRQPMLSWPDATAEADAVIVKPVEVATVLEGGDERLVLAEVLSPFGRAVQFRLPLSTLLREEPGHGQEELEKLVEVTRQDIDTAILAGADGIFYRLRGAEPEFCTPMEYGGFYLERDRELLESVKDARLNVLSVEGGPEVYLDFVSDLPAHLFAFDLNHQSLSDVRSMRSGVLATQHPDAEVLFVTKTSQTGYVEGLASAHG